MVDNWGRGEAGFFLERGEALEQIGRLDEAMSEFKRAVRADPGLAEAHIALGYHYRRKSLLRKAVEEFRTAASLVPSYDAYFNLGHVLVDLGLYQEAITALQQCLRWSPDDPAVRYEVAYALYSAGEHTAAIEHLQPLLALQPDDWELYYLLGSCKLGLGEWSEAESALAKSATLIPTSEDPRDLHEALQIALRYQEFPSIAPWDVKARLYAEYGVACLGSLGDDGLSFPVQPRDRVSQQDIGRTMQRFHALRLQGALHFDAVVALDLQSAALGVAMAHSLGVPLVELEKAPENGRTLLVWAAITLPELLTVTVERLRGPHISFVAVADEASLERVMPDIVGIVSTDRVTLTWASSTGPNSVMRAAREILAAVKSLPPDANLAAQVRYYTQDHPRLRFLEQPDGHAES